MTELTNDELRKKIMELFGHLEECLHDENSTKYMVKLVIELRNCTKTLIERLELHD